MQSIKELREIFETALKQQLFNAAHKELYEPIDYSLSLGGKRLRPTLLLLACDMYSGVAMATPRNVQAAISPAIAIELFHNFTLMHDDIMDQAPLRRGQPTVHEKFDPNTAILSGDAMLVYAYKFMSEVDDKYLSKVLTIFNETAIKVCEGQQLDMNYEKKGDVNVEQYIEMIKLKTATLLAGSIQIGAIIGGADEKDAQRLYEFGQHIGIAFQLKDDILDTFGDATKFGKQPGGDILQNKKTYLLIKAMELAKNSTKDVLMNWIKRNNFSPEKKITEIIRIFEKLNVHSHAENAMQLHLEKALKCLDEVQLEEARKKRFYKIANQLMVRQV